jgi:hypothetical protein
MTATFHTLTDVDWARALRAQGLIILQAELESSCLEVVLVPCRREVNSGGCVRVCANRNCDWYRRFCAAHSSSRQRRKAAFDTRIKRRDTLRLLGRLIEGRPSRSKYVPELLGFALRAAERLNRAGGIAS